MRAREWSEAELRREVVATCRRMAAAGLVGGAEGNVSARLSERRLLSTPTGVEKASLEPHQLVVTRLDGETILGARRASSELRMHLAVYRARPDVRAVVHGHPLTAVALTLAGLDLSRPLVPEQVTALGDGLPTAPYATPSTEALAEGVAQALLRHDACLLERHGATTVGRTLAEACDRLETVERVAQMVLRARVLGGAPLPLPEVEVKKLLGLAGRS